MSESLSMLQDNNIIPNDTVPHSTSSIGGVYGVIAIITTSKLNCWRTCLYTLNPMG
ncbi:MULTISPECIES: hypothetical protein [Vibrio]|uniref:hypothetical protein n=1 Tax=Vibrio TaxID=662 RepID=UPI00097EC8AE|nr:MULTISPECIES: hypothetical protein [Vibrio]SJN17712.1 hypothetical protein FM109_01350 [Vibrio casei]